MKYAAKIFGDAIAEPKRTDLTKLSSLQPGQIVRTLDGSTYRVRSKIAGPDGSVFKLANLQGKPVPTPADFRPVGLAMVRLASWLKWKLAYNHDFDLYVNSYIEKYNQEHPKTPLPFPIGPDGKPFRWAKWFQNSIAPKLHVPTKGPDADALKDEAIHEMLFTVLGQRNILEQFGKKIKNFEKGVRKLEVGNQLTIFLCKSFQFRVSEMREKLQQRSPENEVSMWQEGDDSESDESEINILESPEHAVGEQEFQSAEAKRDIAKFREGFAQWLTQTQGKKVGDSIASMFDLYWELISQTGNRPDHDAEKSQKQQEKDERAPWMLTRSDLEEEWMKRTGLSFGSFKDYFGRLPQLMEEYISSHAAELGENNIFVDLMSKIREQRPKGRPAKASSLNIAGVEEDIAEARSETVSPTTVDTDIKQPVVTVPEAAKVADDEDYHEEKDYYDFPKSWDDKEQHPTPEVLGQCACEWEGCPMGHSPAGCLNPANHRVEMFGVKTRLCQGCTDAEEAQEPSFQIISARKTAKLIAGPDLTPEQRKLVLSAFIYRWTFDNKQRASVYHCDKCDVARDPYVNPKSAEGHQHPTIPMISDDQWVREHAFHFNNNDTLKPRRHAEPVYLAQHNSSRVASVDMKFAIEKAAYNPGQEVYMYKAALYCKDCGEKIKQKLSMSGNVPQNLDETAYDSDTYPKGPYPNGGGEADTPQHCDSCSKFLENPLTQEGYQHLNEMIRQHASEGRGDDAVIAEWKAFYPEADDIGYAPMSEVDETLNHMGASGEQDCCGAFKPKHKPDCKSYNDIFDKTINTLNSMPKSSAVNKQFVRADGTPFEGGAQCIELAPDGQVTVILSDGSGESNSSLDDSMLKEMIRRGFVVERKHAMLGHDINDREGNAIRADITPGDTGRLPHAYKEGAGSNSGDDDPRGAGTNWSEEFYGDKTTGPSSEGMLSGIKESAVAPPENWQCLDCGAEGMLSQNGTCASCGSQAVSSVLPAPPEHARHGIGEHSTGRFNTAVAGKTADTVTMQTQNSTFPATQQRGEPMAVPDAIDQSAGPHSPNAPATAPRTPSKQPRIVDVPNGTVGEEASNMASTASEDANWDDSIRPEDINTHPGEESEDESDNQCRNCNGYNTEIVPTEQGEEMFCQDCQQVTDHWGGNQRPMPDQPKGFKWHGEPFKPSEPKLEGHEQYTQPENEEFTNFMKSIGASKRKQALAQPENLPADYNREDYDIDPFSVDQMSDEQKEAYILGKGWQKENEWHGATWWLGKQQYFHPEYEIPYKDADDAIEYELDRQERMAERQRKSGATPTTAPAPQGPAVNPNVAQQQALHQQLTQPQPNTPASVAIMPGQNEGPEETSIGRHTVEPDLPDSKYHMQGALAAAEEAKLAKLAGLNTFKITFDDGNTVTTDFNGTLEEAENYYLSNYFNFGDTDEHPADKMVQGVSVEQVG